MFLESDDIKLRAIEPEDLEILYQWENKTELWIHGNTLAPYSKLALRQYINDAQQHDIYQAKQLRMMIIHKESETTIGTVDLYDFDPHNSRAGIGILIDEAFRNHNYASQALDIINKYVFEFLHIKQLYAYIAIDNVNSIKLFEKSGYTCSGVLTDWIYCKTTFKDVLIYQHLNDLSQ
jgi:diamine N-acetyltransferase